MVETLKQNELLTAVIKELQKTRNNEDEWFENFESILDEGLRRQARREKNARKEFQAILKEAVRQAIHESVPKILEEFLKHKSRDSPS